MFRCPARCLQSLRDGNGSNDGRKMGLPELPLLGPTHRCRKCAHSLCDYRLHELRRKRRNFKISYDLEPQQEPNLGFSDEFWISKAWVRDLKKQATGLALSNISKGIENWVAWVRKKQPTKATCADQGQDRDQGSNGSSTNSPGALAAVEAVAAVEAAKTSSPIPPSSDLEKLKQSDLMLDLKLFGEGRNSDLKCPHGRLSPDEKIRRRISAAAWQHIMECYNKIAEDYAASSQHVSSGATVADGDYDDDVRLLSAPITFAVSDASCRECGGVHSSAVDHTKQVNDDAKQEKALDVTQRMYQQSAPLPPSNYRSNTAMIGSMGKGKAAKEYWVPSAQHPLYVVSSAWLAVWREYLTTRRKKNAKARPGELQHLELVCEHQLLQYDPAPQFSLALAGNGSINDINKAYYGEKLSLLTQEQWDHLIEKYKLQDGQPVLCWWPDRDNFADKAFGTGQMQDKEDDASKDGEPPTKRPRNREKSGTVTTPLACGNNILSYGNRNCSRQLCLICIEKRQKDDEEKVTCFSWVMLVLPQLSLVTLLATLTTHRI